MREQEYQVYERLGDSLLALNADKAYLCYENAEFLCEDTAAALALRQKKEKLKQSGRVTVRRAAFVILSYNNLYLTQKCLESIRESCAPEGYSIIVVEQASCDGSAEWLAQQPDIKLILCEENTGFPAGCNIGIYYAEQEEDIFLLNNDTRMTHNALFWLRMGLYEDESVGAAGCMANYCGMDQLLDVVFPLPNDYLTYARSINVPCRSPYEEKNRLSGFAMLIKRPALEETGILDEAFSPGYFEDDDLSMRIHAAGRRLLVCHNSFIYHAGSQSFIKRTDMQEIYEKNHAYVMEKWGFDNQVYAAMSEEESAVIGQITHEREEHFRLLEIGAGCGNALTRVRWLYPNAEVYGTESVRNAVENAVRTLPVLWLDWRRDRLPFLERFFDYIILNCHGQTAEEEEIYRILAGYLKENGRIFILE